MNVALWTELLTQDCFGQVATTFQQVLYDTPDLSLLYYRILLIKSNNSWQMLKMRIIKDIPSIELITDSCNILVILRDLDANDEDDMKIPSSQSIDYCIENSILKPQLGCMVDIDENNVQRNSFPNGDILYQREHTVIIDNATINKFMLWFGKNELSILFELDPPSIKYACIKRDLWYKSPSEDLDLPVINRKEYKLACFGEKVSTPAFENICSQIIALLPPNTYFRKKVASFKVFLRSSTVIISVKPDCLILANCGHSYLTDMSKSDDFIDRIKTMLKE